MLRMSSRAVAWPPPGDRWFRDGDPPAPNWQQASKGTMPDLGAATGAQDIGRRIDAAYDAWKDADAMARALVQAVGEAWYRHDLGLGEAPSSELVGRAAALRHDARDKLSHAIQLLHEAGLIQPSPATPSKRRSAGRLRFV